MTAAFTHGSLLHACGWPRCWASSAYLSVSWQLPNLACGSPAFQVLNRRAGGPGGAGLNAPSGIFFPMAPGKPVQLAHTCGTNTRTATTDHPRAGHGLPSPPCAADPNGRPSRTPRLWTPVPPRAPARANGNASGYDLRLWPSSPALGTLRSGTRPVVVRTWPIPESLPHRPRRRHSRSTRSSSHDHVGPEPGGRVTIPIPTLSSTCPTSWRRCGALTSTSRAVLASSRAWAASSFR